MKERKKLSYTKKINLLFYIIWFLTMFLVVGNNSKWFIFYLVFYLVYFIIKGVIYMNNNFITKQFSLYYVHIFGYKRRGKDLTMQLSIVKRFKKKYLKEKRKNKNVEPVLYLSNIDYGYGCKLIDLNDLKLVDKVSGKMLTYNDIITGVYKKMKFDKIEEFEGLDLYISDAQLGLPNTEHNLLDKYYPWLAPFIALAGQLYNMNVHVNTQEYNRLWIKVRGQQDVYLRALKVFPMNKSFFQKIHKSIPILNKWLLMKVRYYEEQQSAENNLLPFNAKAFVNESTKHVYLSAGQSMKEQYNAMNGKIKNKWLAIKIEDIKYDSRIFHEYIFGSKI